jgi:hypothetical protein
MGTVPVVEANPSRKLHQQLKLFKVSLGVILRLDTEWSTITQSPVKRFPGDKPKARYHGAG